MSGCDIIIPVWNQLEVTKDCVDSIKRNTSGPFRLIIIDNGSDLATSSYLKSLESINANPVLLIRNEKNLGFVKAVNQGIDRADSPFVCILNNDTIVTKGWLGEMIAVAGLEKDIGIVNPSSNNLGQKPAELEPLESFANRLKSESGQFIELGAAIGFCMLIKRDLFDRIGKFDEVYGMGNFEDTDFSRRAVKEGYRCVRACGAYVYHRESSSFNKLKTFEEDFNRNREIYEFRWGKPRRIAYIIDRCDDALLSLLELESLKSVRNGDWVWYISRDPVRAPRHSNIQFTILGEKWFYLNAVIMILKKKKKFNEIFVGDRRLGNVLSNVGFLHKAKINYY